MTKIPHRTGGQLVTAPALNILYPTSSNGLAIQLKIVNLPGRKGEHVHRPIQTKFIDTLSKTAMFNHVEV